MAELNIPTEVKDIKAFPQLKKIDRMTVAYAVLFGVDNQTAYALYHPEYMDASGKSMNSAGKQASRQFWSWGKIKDYRDLYIQTIQDFIGGKQSNTNDVEIDENRKDNALKSLLHQAMSLVENGTELDAEGLKTVSDIFKRLHLIKDNDEDVTEKPRRYLPLRCRQECQYRFFVEKHVETGEIVSDCEYCKALAIAKEHGYHYDPTTNLSIPEETETPKENNPE